MSAPAGMPRSASPETTLPTVPSGNLLEFSPPRSCQTVKRRSVPAFLLGTVSAGPSFSDEVAPLSSRRLGESYPAKEKNRKATGRFQACRLYASPRSVGCAKYYLRDPLIHPVWRGDLLSGLPTCVFQRGCAGLRRLYRGSPAVRRSHPVRIPLARLPPHAPRASTNSPSYIL